MRFPRTTLVAVLLLAPAVATAQNREHLQMTADLQILHEQIAQQQLTINQLKAQTEALEARLNDTRDAQVKAFADQKLVIDQMVSTIGTVREKLDDNTTRVAQLSQEVTAVRDGLRLLTDQLNTLVSILQPAVNPTDPNAPPTPGDGSAGGLGPVALPPSPAVYFNDAMNNYLSGRYDLAIEALRDVISKFPESPQAAEAQFYLAESFYNQDKWRQAVPEYEKVRTQYPNAAPERLAFSYFMQGLCYDNLGQQANARKMFEQVIELYPDSTAAVQASQRLNR